MNIPTPEKIEHYKKLLLSEEEYKRIYNSSIDKTIKPSQKILDAAKRLDTEGY